MTHDELLEKIKPEDWREGIPQRDAALRAVVELHKPDEYDGKTCQAHHECWGCGEWGRNDSCDCDSYPCATIQAIEKELK